ncbi:enterochelin esterase [Streptomyces sp. NPDC059373]
MLSALWGPPTEVPGHPPRAPRPAPVERVRSPRITALTEAPEKAPDFWRAVEAEGTPLVEPIAGDPGHAAVTFLWRGGAGTTRAVLALPNKLADPAELTGNLMSRVPGTDVWHWTVRMRTDWRATYALCVDDDPAAEAPRGPAYLRWLHTRPRRDPLNRTSFPRRWGGEPLSVVELPDAPRSRAARWERRPGVRHGEVGVHTMRSANLRNWRRVWTYAPAGYENLADLPVLVLLDGEMWGPELGITTLLDNLIADGVLPPLVALMPDSLDSDTRWDELTCDDSFVDYLTRELLPWAAGRWPVTTDPSRTVLAGQSLGGLMSAYAALRCPERFGNVLVQSGSFWWPTSPADPARGEEWLTDRIEATRRRPIRFRLTAGVQEWLVLPASRRLRDVLMTKGYEVEYREINGGHDYVCWREELAEGLVAMLGGVVVGGW